MKKLAPIRGNIAKYFARKLLTNLTQVNQVARMLRHVASGRVGWFFQAMLEDLMTIRADRARLVGSWSARASGHALFVGRDLQTPKLQLG